MNDGLFVMGCVVVGIVVLAAFGFAAMYFAELAYQRDVKRMRLRHAEMYRAQVINSKWMVE